MIWRQKRRKQVFNTHTKMIKLSVNAYTIEEVAAMLEVSERTVLRRIDQYKSTQGREGIGPVIRDGKIVAVPESSLFDWMQRNTGY